jgi:hypothetical protein
LDCLVGEAHHPVARLDQERFSLVVVRSLCGVHLAIHFDGEATIGTAEINHQWADGMLAAKFEAVKAATPQGIPKNALGRGLTTSKFSRGGHILAMLRAFSGHHSSLA